MKGLTVFPLRTMTKPGVTMDRPSAAVTPALASFSSENAWIVIGTLWIFSERCWAVTTISANSGSSAFAVINVENATTLDEIKDALRATEPNI